MARKDKEVNNIRIDWENKKDKIDTAGITKARKKIVEEAKEMQAAMEVMSITSVGALKSLEEELERINTLEKVPAALRTRQREIKKILDQAAETAAEAKNILADKNIVPQELAKAYERMTESMADAEAQASMLEVASRREAIAQQEAAVAAKERTLATLEAQAAYTQDANERAQIEEKINAILKERAGVQEAINDLAEEEAVIRETAAQKKADAHKSAETVRENAPVANTDKLHTAMNKVSESMHKLVNITNALNISKIADRFNLQETERQKIRRESENTFGLSHAEFEDYRKETITQMTNGLDGLFSNSDLKQYLQDANKFGFESAEQAAKMSQDIMIGNKLLGLSTDTQVAAYQLQRKLGDDNFIKKQNDRIAGLLESQLGIEQAQLNQMEKENLSLAEAAAGMGMDKNAIEEATKQLNALEIGDPAAKKAMEEYIKGDVDTKAIMGGENAQQVEQLVRQGQMIEAYKLMSNNQVVNSRKAESGNMWSATALQGFGSDTMYNASLMQADDFWDRVNEAKNAQDNGDSSKTAQDQLEKMTPQDKWANGISMKMEEIDWGVLIGIEKTEQIVSAAVQSIEQMMQLIALWDLGKSIFDLGKNLLSGKGFGGIKSGLKSLGSKMGNLLGPHSAGNIPMATKAIGGASLVAGLAWMGIDAYKGAKEGLTDDKGNQIMKGGVGSSVISAVSGSKVATTESAGSSAKASTQNIGGSALNGAGKGALIGAGIGSFIPGVGTAVGAGVGAVVGAISGAIGGIFKDQERKKIEAEKKTQEELQKIAENTFNTERAIGSLGTQVSVRWRPDQVSYGGGINNNYTSFNRYGVGGGGSQFGIGGSHPADPGHKPPITAGWPTYPSGSPHKGVDFGVVKGTPIGASVSGTIEKVGTGITRDGWLGNYNDNGGWGNYVMIRGEDGNRYTYAHLSQVNVSSGKIKAGTQIGLSGNTGNTSGPHLHYQVDDSSGNNIDPFPYITSGIFDLDPNAAITSPDNSGYTTEEMKLLASQMSNAGENADAGVVRDIAKRQFTYNYNDLSSGVGGGSDNAPVVAGLKDIKDTLVELANRQNYQQKLIDALSSKPIKLSVKGG